MINHTSAGDQHACSHTHTCNTRTDKPIAGQDTGKLACVHRQKRAQQLDVHCTDLHMQHTRRQTNCSARYRKTCLRAQAKTCATAQRAIAHTHTCNTRADKLTAGQDIRTPCLRAHAKARATAQRASAHTHICNKRAEKPTAGQDTEKFACVHRQKRAQQLNVQARTPTHATRAQTNQLQGKT
jgi:hypothetical protein